MKPFDLAANTHFISITLLIFLTLSCAAPSASPQATATPAAITVKAGWEAEWEKMLQAGRKEGSVTVYSTAGSEVRNAFNETFPKATGINLDFTTGRSTQISAKISTEKNAGLHIVDVYTGGLTTIITELKPKGYIQPLKPYLVLPEVTDPGMWFRKELPFTDTNRDTVFSFRANPGGFSVIINTEQVRKDELTSYYDLLNPKWKGKITTTDLTSEGGGLKWFKVSLLFYGLDIDFMKQLVLQEPYITRDERQHVEWIARGKYPIGIAPSSDAYAEFIKAGAPIRELAVKEEKLYLSTGGGNVVLFDKAPHPNAAKVFINWLLTREGQTAFSKARLDQSARIDVPTDHLPPHKRIDPKTEYIIVDKEDIQLDPTYIELTLKAREIFGHLVR